MSARGEINGLFLEVRAHSEGVEHRETICSSKSKSTAENTLLIPNTVIAYAYKFAVPSLCVHLQNQTKTALKNQMGHTGSSTTQLKLSYDSPLDPGPPLEDHLSKEASSLHLCDVVRAVLKRFDAS